MGKLELIIQISDIIKEYGSFSTMEVEAEYSPSLPSRGNIIFLAEEFMEETCVVYVYNSASVSLDEIDVYNETYEEFSEEQLEYILELSHKWKEQNKIIKSN